jgi:hypothetical protein
VIEDIFVMIFDNFVVGFGCTRSKTFKLLRYKKTEEIIGYITAFFCSDIQHIKCIGAVVLFAASFVLYSLSTNKQ